MSDEQKNQIRTKTIQKYLKILNLDFLEEDTIDLNFFNPATERFEEGSRVLQESPHDLDIRQLKTSGKSISLIIPANYKKKLDMKAGDYVLLSSWGKYLEISKYRPISLLKQGNKFFKEIISNMGMIDKDNDLNETEKTMFKFRLFDKYRFFIIYKYNFASWIPNLSENGFHFTIYNNNLVVEESEENINLRLEIEKYFFNELERTKGDRNGKN